MARHFVESDHPRDSNGQFIKKGSRVTAAGGALQGVVERIEPRATTSGGPLVHVRLQGQSGTTAHLLPGQLTVTGVSDKSSEEGWVKKLVGRMRGGDQPTGSGAHPGALREPIYPRDPSGKQIWDPSPDARLTSEHVSQALAPDYGYDPEDEGYDSTNMGDGATRSIGEWDRMQATKRAQLNELYDELGIDERGSIEDYLDTLNEADPTVPDSLDTGDMDYALAQHLTTIEGESAYRALGDRLDPSQFPRTLGEIDAYLAAIGAPPIGRVGNARARGRLQGRYGQ